MECLLAPPPHPPHRLPCIRAGRVFALAASSTRHATCPVVVAELAPSHLPDLSADAASMPLHD